MHVCISSFRTLVGPFVAVVMLFLVGAGCATSSEPSEREAKARFQYNRIMREYQVPAGEASNAVDRVTLLGKAAEEYRRLADEYADVPKWAAASLRSLGRVEIERGQFKEGLACFELVGQRFPNEHWEVIQAWKSAADTLWDTRHQGEARLYYRQIVNTYGRPGQPAMFDTIVGIARSRLEEGNAP